MVAAHPDFGGTAKQFQERMRAFFFERFDSVLEGVCQEVSRVTEKLQHVMASEKVRSFLENIETSCRDGDAAALLELATYEEGKDSYTTYKFIENFRAPLKDLSEFTGAVRLSKYLETADMQQAEGNKLAAKLTVVQVMARPLNIGETRDALAKRCKMVLQSDTKHMWSVRPAHLKAVVEKHLGSADNRAQKWANRTVYCR